MFYKKRIVLHLLFWFVYFAVSIYNELFLSSSFTNNPSLTLIFQAIISQLLPMTIKVPLVYILIYYLIPKWFSKPNKPLIILEGAGIFIFATIMHRIIIQQLVWIYVYDSVHPGLG